MDTDQASNIYIYSVGETVNRRATIKGGYLKEERIEQAWTKLIVDTIKIKMHVFFFLFH